MAEVDCTQFEDLYTAALLVIANAEKLRDWVNGDEQTDIELGGKLTPTIRKLVGTIDARESAAAKEVIAKGLADISLLKSETQELVQQAEDAAERAEEAAQGVKSTIGTGKCPNVSRRVQVADQASGLAIATPPYYPFAGGIHIFYDGVLLSSNLHYKEQMPGADGTAEAVVALFDVKAGAEWEFHTWDDVGESDADQQGA